MPFLIKMLMRPFIQTAGILCLCVSLQAAPRVAATNNMLHSIVSYLLQGVEEPALLGTTVKIHGQVDMIDARVLFYDSRVEDLAPYLRLYFSDPQQHSYDLSTLPGLGSMGFLYGPGNVSALALILARTLQQELPDAARVIGNNYLFFEKEMLRYRGAASEKDFWDHADSPEALDARPQERYFVVLSHLGLLTRDI